MKLKIYICLLLIFATFLEIPIFSSSKLDKLFKRLEKNRTELYKLCLKKNIDEAAVLQEIDNSSNLKVLGGPGGTALACLCISLRRKDVETNEEFVEEDKKRARLAAQMLKKEPEIIDIWIRGVCDRPLVSAAKHNLSSTVKLLVSMGANINDKGIPDEEFYKLKYPFFTQKIISFLLARGLDPNKYKYGISFRDSFCKVDRKSGRKIQQTLLFYGLNDKCVNCEKYHNTHNDHPLFRPYFALREDLTAEERKNQSRPMFHNVLAGSYEKFQDGDRQEFPNIVFGLPLLEYRTGINCFIEQIAVFFQERVKADHQIELCAALPRDVQEVGMASDLAEFCVNRKLTEDERFLFRERLHLIDDQRRHRKWTPAELEERPIIEEKEHNSLPFRKKTKSGCDCCCLQ